MELLNIMNKQLLEVNRGKNIKFKATAKKLLPSKYSLIIHLNLAIDDSGSALNCNKYFEPNEMTNLIVEYSESLSPFHVNILSLPFHFEGFLKHSLKSNYTLTFLEYQNHI